MPSKREGYMRDYMRRRRQEKDSRWLWSSGEYLERIVGNLSETTRDPESLFVGGDPWVIVVGR